MQIMSFIRTFSCLIVFNVINFSVAHSERYKDSQGNQKERTTWVECAYWTDKAALVPYLRKGQLVFVEGVPELRTFTRNDGSPGSALSLRVFGVRLLGSSRGNENMAEGEELVAANEDGTDLPF